MSNVSKKKVVIYTRTAKSFDQDGRDKLAEQEDLCRKWCDDNDCVVVRVFTDISAGELCSRLGLLEMVEYVVAQRETSEPVEQVMVVSLDRIFRRTEDFINFKTLLDDLDVQVCVHPQPPKLLISDFVDRIMQCL